MRVELAAASVVLNWSLGSKAHRVILEELGVQVGKTSQRLGQEKDRSGSRSHCFLQRNQKYARSKMEMNIMKLVLLSNDIDKSVYEAVFFFTFYVFFFKKTKRWEILFIKILCPLKYLHFQTQQMLKILYLSPSPWYCIGLMYLGYGQTRY